MADKTKLKDLPLLTTINSTTKLYASNDAEDGHVLAEDYLNPDSFDLIDLNETTEPPIPVGKGTLYVQGQELKFKDSNGDITEISDGITSLNKTTALVMSTGATSFGGLELNADPKKYDHGEVTGVIVDNTTDPENPTIIEVTVPAATGVIIPPEFLPGVVTVLAYDVNGDPFYKNSLNLTNEEARDFIMVGFLISLDGANLDEVINSTTTSVSPASQLFDLLKALQPISNGLKYSPNGANLKIDRTAGSLMGLGFGTLNIPPSTFRNPNSLDIVAETEVNNMLYALSIPGGTPIVDNNIDPNIWESPLGTQAVVANQKFTIQYIVSFVQGRTNIQIGQTEYASMAEAKNAIESEMYVKNGAIEAFATVLCALVLKQGITDLTAAIAIDEAFFKNFGKLGGNV